MIEIVDDHPLLVICIIALLCAVSAVLFVSRRKILSSERRYRALFEDNGAVMLIVDMESMRIMNANPAACAFYGWRPVDLLNMKITDISSSPEGKIRELHQDILEYEMRRFRSRHRLASGGTRDVEVFAIPYQFEGRECIFAIVHEMTGKTADSGSAS